MHGQQNVKIRTIRHMCELSAGELTLHLLHAINALSVRQYSVPAPYTSAYELSLELLIT